MKRLGEALFDLITGRPRLTLALLAGLVGLSAYGLTRLKLDEDLIGLVAGGEGRVAEALTSAKAALDDFGALETLLIDVSGPEDREALEAATDEVIARLEASGQFRSIMHHVERRGFERLFARRLDLLGPPTAFAAGLEALRRDLMAPVGALEPMLLRDPANQRQALVEALQAAGPRLALDVSGARLLSEDQRHALLITEPEADPLDRGATGRLLETIQAAAPEGVVIQPIGAHVFAYASASGVRQDVWITVGASLLGVLLLFGLVLRRAAPTLALLAPVGVGGLAAVGLWGLSGAPIHGIALGFGAVMIGISVDYGAHLIIHQAHGEGDRLIVARQTYSRLLGSLLVGALTTLAGFAALGFSELNALVVFSRFAILGVGVAFLAALLLLPLLLPLTPYHGPRRAAKPARRRRLAPLIVYGALVVVAIMGLERVRFSGAVRELDRQRPELMAVEEAFNARYGQPRFRTLVIASGSSEAEALERAERASARLARARDAGEIGRFYGPTALLPSPATQAARWAAFDAPAALARMRREADQAGMNPAALAPFVEELAAARDRSPTTATDLAETPAAPLLDRMLVEVDGRHRALTMAYTDDPSRPALPARLREALEALPGVEVISSAGLAEAGIVAVMDGVASLSLLSLGLITLLLVLYYGRPSTVLYALTPVLTAFLFTWGAMGWLDAPFNLVSVGAFALLAGIAVDYGIFMTDAAIAGHAAPTRRSVRLAAATTLLGFTSLLLAHSPVMFSLGLAVSVGVLAALWTTNWALPALWSWVGAPRAGRARPWGWLLLLPLSGLMVALLMAHLRGGRYEPAWAWTIVALDLITVVYLAIRMERRAS